MKAESSAYQLSPTAKARSRRAVLSIAALLPAMPLLSGFSPVLAKPRGTNAKEVVTAFYDLAFTQGKVAEAAEKYISPTTYIQHNPRVADGREAFVAVVGNLIQTSGLRAEIKRVIAEKNLVVVHARWTIPGKADAKASAIVDIFRVENGRIVEHWDVVQEVPENAANRNTMF